jgi:hypothetical protein
MTARLIAALLLVCLLTPASSEASTPASAGSPRLTLVAKLSTLWTDGDRYAILQRFGHQTLVLDARTMRSRPLKLALNKGHGPSCTLDLDNTGAGRQFVAGRLLVGCGSSPTSHSYSEIYDVRSGRTGRLPRYLRGHSVANFDYLGRYWVMDSGLGAYLNLGTGVVRYSAAPIDIDRPGFDQLHSCPADGQPAIADETRWYSPPYLIARTGTGSSQQLRLLRCGGGSRPLGPGAFRIGISDGLAWADDIGGSWDTSRLFDIRTGRMYEWQIKTGPSAYVQWTAVTRYRVFLLKATAELWPGSADPMPTFFNVYTARLPR